MSHKECRILKEAHFCLCDGQKEKKTRLENNNFPNSEITYKNKKIFPMDMDFITVVQNVSTRGQKTSTTLYTTGF